MSHNLINAKIVDQESLMYVCDLLHDAKLDLGQFKNDSQSGFVEAFFEREFFENEDLMIFVPKFLLFTKITFPYTLAQLKLRNVVSLDVDDRSNIGIYTFNECRRIGNKYQFSFCEDMKITVRFKDMPSGELCDLKILEKKGSIYILRNPLKNKIGHPGRRHA